MRGRRELAALHLAGSRAGRCVFEVSEVVCSVLLVGLELRGEAVEVAWEQGDLADVGGSGEAGDPSFESDGEPAVGWHAEAERFEVAPERGEVLAGEPGLVVLNEVEALAAGHEFEALEEQIEAVRHGRVVGSGWV